MFKYIKEKNETEQYCNYISKQYNIEISIVKEKLEERLNKYKKQNIDINKISDFFDIMQVGTHIQKPLIFNNIKIDIDENIFEIIEFINKPFNKFITQGISCQHNCYGYASISFDIEGFTNWILYLFENNKKAFDYISDNDLKYIKFRFTHFEGYELPCFYYIFSFEQPEIDFFKNLLKN
jgi:hypothetical protein